MVWISRDLRIILSSTQNPPRQFEQTSLGFCPQLHSLHTYICCVPFEYFIFSIFAKSVNFTTTKNLAYHTVKSCRILYTKHENSSVGKEAIERGLEEID